MSSSNSVNFSLRQNKSIERSIVFDGLRSLIGNLEGSKYIYVGLGSVWFSDFQRAHRDLGFDRLISIESNEIVFRRAQFNKPFRSVEVLQGLSRTVVPTLLERDDLCSCPWVVWLDYDQAIDAEKVQELSELVRDLPVGSILLTTFSATPGQYGKPKDRPSYLRGLFGDVVPDALTVDDCRDENLMTVLARLTSDYLASCAVRFGRPGSYHPAFRLAYRDGAPMVTVGGVLPRPVHVAMVESALACASWKGFVDTPISTPPLTLREVTALNAMLPTDTPITRAQIQKSGMDLEEAQLSSFVDHYLRYPSFLQVSL
jgi:hypothetical protein